MRVGGGCSGGGWEEGERGALLLGKDADGCGGMAVEEERCGVHDVLDTSVARGIERDRAVYVNVCNVYV